MKKQEFIKRIVALVLGMMILCSGSPKVATVLGEEDVQTYYSDWLSLPPTEENSEMENCLSVQGEDYLVRVTAATDNILPEGTELAAHELTNLADYKDRVAETIGIREDNIEALRVFDLSLLLDGNEIQPSGSVHVALEMDVPGEKNLSSALPEQHAIAV